MIFKKIIDTIKFRMGMASCSEYVALVQDLVNNQASKQEEIHVRRHMKMCVKCLDKVNLDQELKKSLHERLEVLKTPPGLADSILGKIESAK